MRSKNFSMNGTIDVLEQDIYAQVRSLSSFRPQTCLTVPGQRRSVFCGSGDSLAACMLAEAFSNYTTRAADPLDLIKNGHMLADKDAYIVSISGRTISNIRAARLAKKSIAITSNPGSRLAKSCTGIIRLRFPNSDVMTAGSISFLDSALTCMSLVCDFEISDAHNLFERAESISRYIRLQNRVYFLGNMHTYPVAMYAAAKMCEVLGYDAHYERLEQFSHMGLFSATKGDTAVILEEKTPHNIRLTKKLQSAGLYVIHPDPDSNDKVEQFLFFTFLSQLVPLYMARQGGQTDCYFMTAEKLRKASDEMIY